MVHLTQYTNSNRLFIGLIIGITTLLYIFNSFFIMDEKPDQTTLFIFYFVLFIILFVICFSWLKTKLVIKSENEELSNPNLINKIIFFITLFFPFFFFLTIVNIFSEKFTQLFNVELIKYLYILSITVSNILLAYQLNLIFKQQTRPNAYIFKFLIRKIQSLSNNYETVFTLKVLFFIGIFILPFILGFFLTKDLVSDYLLMSLFINLLLAGYWIGYGLYKYFVWVWGKDYSLKNIQANQRNKRSIIKDLLNFKVNENRSILFGFFFTLFTLFLTFFAILTYFYSPIFHNLYVITAIVTLYVLCLYAIVLNIIGQRTESQPWYSSTFVIYSFTLPFDFSNVFGLILNPTSMSSFQITSSQTPAILFLLLLGCFISIFLIITVNNNYLTVNLWKDPYEANQLLTSLKLSKLNPSTNQLILLQKVANTLNDKETILKIITLYESILQSESIKSEQIQIKGIISFINNQLEVTIDDEIFEHLFELIHTFLDNSPEYAQNLFEGTLKVLKTSNSTVKYGVLNVLGHILQLEPNKNFTRILYSELETIYDSPDEKLKRLILDAFVYFINNFIEFIPRIQNFITDKLEFESLGLVSVMYTLLENIYSKTKDENIINLTKAKLESLDSPAKIGAISFLRTHWPSAGKEIDIFTSLLIKNLEDIDNATGVRPSIVYTLNELIKINKIEISLLEKIKSFINDSDSDVQTAIIQTFTDHYILKKIPIEDLESILSIGTETQDYVVRLVVVQSLLLIAENKKEDLDKFSSIIDKMKNDDSEIVRNKVKDLEKS